MKGNGTDPTAALRYGWVERDGEDFSGTQLNLSRWQVYSGPGTDGVGVRDPSTVSVDNGMLAIRAHGDVSGGLAWRPTPAVTYGRWEFRARSEPGTGYAPVILLWPDSERWPQDGEIDIMEITAGDRSSMTASVIMGSTAHQTTATVAKDFTQWHAFAVDRQPDHLAVFVDGDQVLRISDPALPHGPMHLAIQNDVGPLHNWIPPRDSSTPPVVGMYVDWVRLYQ